MWALLLKLIIISPLSTALILGFIKNLSKKTINTISIGSSSIILISTFTLIYAIGMEPNTINHNFYNWINISSINFTFGAYLDSISMLMLVMVSIISLLVQVFTIGYMNEDESYQRFFCYLNLFSFFMFWLILSNNLLQMFIGWEGVGLVSYLLIGFWYHKPSAIKANLKAFLVNRLGDAALVAAIVLLFVIFKSLEFDIIFEQLPGYIIGKDYNENIINMIALLLFIGAMAKSAQVPLHLWLPDSMEGPTPISALIHAATMVTAGIYLVIRMSPVFEITIPILNIIMWVGSLTSLLLGSVALFQTDIKKIIAYSTISQLGYMVASLGLASFDNALFHLFTHAFFKAGLFLGAGAIIYAMHHEQNIFKMGGLKRELPLLYYLFLICTLSLVGFPGFAGFYSKEAIITVAKTANSDHHKYIYYILMTGVLITSIYSFRLFFVVFHGEKNSKSTVHDVSKVMTVPIAILAIFSIFTGLYFVKQDWAKILIHGLISIKLLLIALGFALTWVLYIRFPKKRVELYNATKILAKVFENKLGFDLILDKIIVPSYFSLSKFLTNLIDVKIIDNIFIMPARGIYWLAGKLKYTHTGYIYHYVLIMMLTSIAVWFSLSGQIVLIGA